jgi:pimeloyl-ACP methyl ester carboxylesterase
MSLSHERPAVVTWTEPEGLAPRGTVIVVPGRGEQPEVYERFGRRIASDAYRVHVVANPVEDADLSGNQIEAQLSGPRPVVLAGSDTGALYAAGLAASGLLPGVDALILAGLPADAGTGDAGTADGGTADGGAEPAASWEDELEARTTCPTHRGRLAGGAVRQGALYDPVPKGWADSADLAEITQPVLGLHGADDPVSALGAARDQYAAAPNAELVSFTGTTHDALNNATHRTVAATVILFLERLRLGTDLAPIAVREKL